MSVKQNINYRSTNLGRMLKKRNLLIILKQITYYVDSTYSG